MSNKTIETLKADATLADWEEFRAEALSESCSDVDAESIREMVSTALESPRIPRAKSDISRTPDCGSLSSPINAGTEAASPRRPRFVAAAIRRRK